MPNRMHRKAKQFDRKSAEVLLAIKRNLPYQQQSDFKLSAPNIENTVFDLFLTTEKHELRALCRSFLQNRGPKWASKVSEQNRHDQQPLFFSKIGKFFSFKAHAG